MASIRATLHSSNFSYPLQHLQDQSKAAMLRLRLQEQPQCPLLPPLTFSLAQASPLEMSSLGSLVHVAWLALRRVCVISAACHEVWCGNAGTFVLALLDEHLQ